MEEGFISQSFISPPPQVLGVSKSLNNISISERPFNLSICFGIFLSDSFLWQLQVHALLGIRSSPILSTRCLTHTLPAMYVVHSLLRTSSLCCLFFNDTPSFE